MACHCDDFSEAQAGRGLRGIEPGMPTPAGTGLSRRSFLARGSGLALSVFGGSLLSSMAFEEGIAKAQGAARLARARLDLPVRRPRLALDARADRRRPLRGAAAEPRADPERQRRRRVQRGRPPALAPERRAAARPAPRGQGLGHAGDRLRRPQPVALHVAALLGGRRDQPVRPRRLARALPRQARRRRQPAPGALARREPRAVAGGGRQAGRGGLEPRVLLARRPRRLGRRHPHQDDRRAARAGHARHRRPRSCARPAPPPSRPSACATSSPASRAPTRRGRPRSPTRARTASRAGSRCWRRCSTWACR